MNHINQHINIIFNKTNLTKLFILVAKKKNERDKRQCPVPQFYNMRSFDKKFV